MHIVLKGRVVANALVRFLGVAPDEIIDEGKVEWFCIADVLFVVFQELGAEGAVKALDEGICLGVPGVGVEVFDGAVANGLDEKDGNLTGSRRE